MLPHERQQRILELIRAKGTVTVAELSRLLNVTPMTIRRDLRSLTEKSLLEQTYGGAILRRGVAFEPPFPSREVERAEQKRAIAEKAAALIRDGETIALDVGTTALELARCLKRRSALVVLTPSLQIALELAVNPAIRVILAGGIVRPGELSLVGESAVATIERFYVDKAFLGAAGIAIEHGVSDYSLDDTGVKKAILRRAKEVFLLADSAKFGRVALAQICPVTALSGVVTDAELARSYQTDLERQGIRVILAD